MTYLLLGLTGLLVGFILGRKSQEPLLKKDVLTMEHMAEALNNTQETSQTWKKLAFQWRQKANGVETEPLTENEDEGPMLH